MFFEQSEKMINIMKFSKKLAILWKTKRINGNLYIIQYLNAEKKTKQKKALIVFVIKYYWSVQFIKKLKTIMLKCFWDWEIYSNRSYYLNPDEEYHDEKMYRFIFRNIMKNMLHLFSKKIKIYKNFFKVGALTFPLEK